MTFSKPNISFISKLKKDSNAPLKQCMQCGNCTVVCNLATEDNPFPRREMNLAAWGQKDSLLADPNIWLCHQCGDCSNYCPRGVQPGDVMAALRMESVIHYAKPAFLARLISKPWFLFIGLLVPFAIIYIIRSLTGSEGIPAGMVNYSKFFPHATLNTTFGILVFLVSIGVVLSIRSYVKAVKYDKVFQKRKISWSSLFSGLKEILTHKRFKSCQEFKLGYYAHFLIFWGFVLLLFVTLFAIISVLFFEYPIPLWNPIKITGNLASIMLFAGLTSLIIMRIVRRKSTNSTYFDWVFLISFYLLIISGILVEVFRFADLKSGYYIYYFHLVLVWFIIIYAPYTKFGHVIYRIIAYGLSSKQPLMHQGHEDGLAP